MMHQTLSYCKEELVKELGDAFYKSRNRKTSLDLHLCKTNFVNLRLLKQELHSSNVEITEKEIITDKNFKL